MKVFNIIAVLIFVGVVGFITYSLIIDSDRKYYITTHVEVATINEKLNLSGYVFPSKEIDVKPQISGVVDAVYASVGDRVKEGDPIASVCLVPNSSEVEQLNNAVNLAQIALSAAQTTYNRQKQLIERNVISKAEFEISEKEYQVAKENYSTAVAQLSLRQKGNKTPNNIIRSSTDGVIIDIPVKVGSSVVERGNFNAGTTVATIAGDDHYVFRAEVLEKNIGSLYLGMPVCLELIAYEGVAIEAIITNISAKGEMRDGTVKFPMEAEFTLQDKKIGLRSGYSATAQILLSSVVNAIALPEKCLNFKGDTIFVYVTDSLCRSVVERRVRPGLSDGEKVQIIDGVNENDLIITNYYD